MSVVTVGSVEALVRLVRRAERSGGWVRPGGTGKTRPAACAHVSTETASDGRNPLGIEVTTNHIRFVTADASAPARVIVRTALAHGGVDGLLIDLASELHARLDPGPSDGEFEYWVEAALFELGDFPTGPDWYER